MNTFFFLSQKIADLRKRNHLTQSELAEQLGVSFQAVSGWERGENLPDLSRLPLLCKVLGISPEELFSQSDESYDKPSQLKSSTFSSWEEAVAQTSCLSPEESSHILCDNIALAKSLEQLGAVAWLLPQDVLESRIASLDHSISFDTLTTLLPYLSQTTLCHLLEENPDLLDSAEKYKIVAPFLPQNN